MESFFEELKHRRYNSFSNFIQTLIEEIKTRRSSLKLFENNSLDELERSLLDVEMRLTSRMNDEHRLAAPAKLKAPLQKSFDKTLDALRNLLTTLSRYQRNNDRRKRLRTSPVDEKPVTTRSKSRNHEEEEQSSETSHSSIGDEILMELARVAYEGQPIRSKKK